jgi:hypothetical protein
MGILVVGVLMALEPDAHAAQAQSRTLPASVGTQSGQGSPVSFKDGRLSVYAQDRSLERLIDEISAKSGIPIVLSDVGSQLVSANFQNLPLDEGLRQILSKYDAFFFYGADEQHPSSLKAVWVYPKGKARGVEPVPPEKWASTKDIEAMLADKDPEVRGRAIESLVERKGEVALDAVLKCLHDDDAQVRTQALYEAVNASLQVPEEVLT